MTFSCVAFAANDISVSNVSPDELNQNSTIYVGKQVALTGRIDRVLGNGAYIVSDLNKSSSKDPAHRVLIFTAAMSAKEKKELSRGNGFHQQAGVAALALKEGDTVLLNGKVEALTVSNEIDVFSPKTDTEDMSESVSAVPVVIIRPGNIRKNS
jgi:hypothetical protein